ncbi:hypothetical protein FPSE_11255, partial [Fusarium pseudograminearum CS3096]
ILKGLNINIKNPKYYNITFLKKREIVKK